MKILVTGRAIPQQPDRCTGQQLVRGFQEAGHEAYFYGCFYGDPTTFLGGQECQEVNDWDLVVYTEMNDGMPGYEPLFEYHKLKDVPRLYWDFDISYHPDRSFRQAGGTSYDGYLVGNKLWVDKFSERFDKPALHLGYACSPTIHKRKPDLARNFLLGFIGSITPERQKVIDVAQQAMLNSAWFHHAEGIFGDALVDTTNSYCAMLHHNQDACHGLVPGRPWETAGCGTTLLMDRNSHNDFIEFLPEHHHEDVFVYDNMDDIRAWASRWQEKWATLQLHGESLGHYVRNNHSYKNRAETIIEWCKDEGML